MKEFEDLYRDINSIVNQYTGQFKRKKAAWGLHNAKLKQKGSIDMSRIYSYKTSDNIFQKKVIQPKEKSHGLILLIDNSGSMTPNIFSVVQKATELAIFAVRNDIDMECYLFTDTYNKKYIDCDIKLDGLLLSNLYNRTMSEQDIRNIFYDYYLYTFNKSLLDVKKLQNLQNFWYMSGTPLIEAYLGVVERAKLMKLRDIQHINVCVLTDGGANSPLYCKDGNLLSSFLDPFTQNIYTINKSLKLPNDILQLEMFNRILKDINITTTHVHITSYYSFYDKILTDEKYREKFDNDMMVLIDNNPIKFDKTILIDSKCVNIKQNSIDYNSKSKINQVLTKNIIDTLCQYYITRE